MRRILPFMALLSLALPAVARAHTTVRGTAMRSIPPFSSGDFVLLIGGGIAMIVVGFVVRHLTSVLDPNRRHPTSAPAPAGEPGHVGSHRIAA